MSCFLSFFFYFGDTQDSEFVDLNELTIAIFWIWMIRTIFSFLNRIMLTTGSLLVWVTLTNVNFVIWVILTIVGFLIWMNLAFGSFLIWTILLRLS